MSRTLLVPTPEHVKARPTANCGDGTPLACLIIAHATGLLCELVCIRHSPSRACAPRKTSDESQCRSLGT